MDDLTFGQRITLFRKKSNMLQKELAEKLGISSTALNYYEKDKRDPTVSMINKIAQVLNVTGDELLGTTHLPSPMLLTDREKRLVTAYRDKPDMQPAVNKLLGLDE